MSVQQDKGVAVVTGASRGVGRGVAEALGAAGMTVYVTGRSNRESVARLGDEVLPGTIHETAALVERIAAEQGKLDILVNNAIYIDDSLIDAGPFWQKPLSQVKMFDVGLRSNYVASYYAAPLLIKAGKGLIAFTSSFGAGCYMHGPAYGAQKAGCDKMAWDMAVDFEGSGVAALSLWLGVQRTERTEVAARMRGDAYGDFMANSESPQFVGRIIHALWQDPRLAEVSGQTLIPAELAAQYGVTDDNGKVPPSWREMLGAPLNFHPARVS